MRPQISEGCILCSEQITQPVCFNCLAKEMACWLDERNKALVPLLIGRASIFKVYKHKAARCIICKGNMNVCAHCFSMEIHDWLNESYPDIAEEFGEYFNFDLRTECCR
ncbi:MAG: hypothetical protein Q7J54_01585 [Candidatus Woesearchaeota archaeon]|nr:hypothetical protein [Candidatus Woesearchaeota archaeon]